MDTNAKPTLKGLLRYRDRVGCAADAINRAIRDIDDARLETRLIPEWHDRVMKLLDMATDMRRDLNKETDRLSVRIESLPPEDEDDAGDALAVAQRPDRFETA